MQYPSVSEKICEYFDEMVHNMLVKFITEKMPIKNIGTGAQYQKEYLEQKEANSVQFSEEIHTKKLTECKKFYPKFQPNVLRSQKYAKFT